MRYSWMLATWLALVWASPVNAGPVETPAAPPTRVIVLGVDHAVQLVAQGDQPGMLAAFIEKVGPDAICVERAPEPFARGDHYEFTYEIQDIVLPYAARHGIATCPIDWEPSHEDQMLGWGLDLTRPPEVRAASGFQGFLSFPEEQKLQRTLFHADDRANLARVDAWARGWPEQPAHDLPRRMYLYRTFMQARRIEAAARARPGQTLLVVIGEFHKHDIEAILGGNAAIELVQPSSYGQPGADAVARLTTRPHRIAIASFNLLGMQATTGNVDWSWLGDVLDALEADGTDAETALLRTRHDLLTRRIGGDEAIARYRRIADNPDARRMPTWNGALDRTRVDSYFDPFGNLRIDQRARVELARELYRQGDAGQADTLLQALRSELPPRKARQLDAYWQRELVTHSEQEAD